MIDIHTHIVFGIDDGARDIEESKEMIRLAVEDGVTHMVATSHYAQDAFNYELDEYHNNLSQIKQWIKEEQLNMEIYSGHEFYLEPNALIDLRDKKCLTINQTDYILVEIANCLNTSKVEEMLGLIEHMGYKIIIAHTERLKWVLDDFEVIQGWYQKGYSFQVNGSSILRKDYKENYKSAHKLIRHGYVHMISSDGHRKNRRQPLLKNAYNYLESVLGYEGAQLLCVNNPLNVTKGLTIRGLKEYSFNKGYYKKRFIRFLRGDLKWERNTKRLT